MSTSAHQTSYQLLCQMLRGALRDTVRSTRDGSGGISSVGCRAVAVLYGLLLDHPVDRRGRCRSCRRPGEVLGLRRRRCRVHRKTHFYLHHPDDAFLLGHLAREVGLPAPAASPPRPSGRHRKAGRPDPDHGGVEDDPHGPRPRRGPSPDQQSPDPGHSLVIVERTTPCPT